MPSIDVAGGHAHALAVARDTGMPLDKASALEGIGHSHLQGGNPARAAGYLRHARTIYQRIGAPDAQRVQQTLHHHALSSNRELRSTDDFRQ